MQRGREASARRRARVNRIRRLSRLRVEAQPAEGGGWRSSVCGIRVIVSMKTSLEYLPEEKREQVTAVAALLQAEAPVEMVIRRLETCCAKGRHEEGSSGTH